jgi:hypothetical protein
VCAMKRKMQLQQKTNCEVLSRNQSKRTVSLALRQDAQVVRSEQDTLLRPSKRENEKETL